MQCTFASSLAHIYLLADNVATPIASALGDMVTLVILGVLSSIFAKFMGEVLLLLLESI